MMAGYLKNVSTVAPPTLEDLQRVGCALKLVFVADDRPNFCELVAALDHAELNG